MGAVEKRTFSLPEAQAAFIDAKVEAGHYASASEVVRAGLRALQQHDAAIERWLREEVVPTYERMKANPESWISAEDMREKIRRLHERHVAAKAAE